MNYKVLLEPPPMSWNRTTGLSSSQLLLLPESNLSFMAITSFSSSVYHTNVHPETPWYTFAWFCSVLAVFFQVVQHLALFSPISSFFPFICWRNGIICTLGFLTLGTSLTAFLCYSLSCSTVLFISCESGPGLIRFGVY